MGENAVCSECNGSGVVDHRDYWPYPKYLQPCLNCNGSGEEPTLEAAIGRYNQMLGDAQAGLKAEVRCMEELTRERV